MGTVLNVQVSRAGQLIGQHQFDSETHRTIKIGRLSSAQLKLEDSKVSRIHAVIELTGADPSLIDMGSTTGTLVNGERVHKVKLKHGDQVMVGDTLLVMGIGAPAAGMAAQAPAAAPPMGMPQQMPAEATAPPMSAAAAASGMMSPQAFGQPMGALGQMSAPGQMPISGQMAGSGQMPISGQMPTPGQVPAATPMPGDMLGQQPPDWNTVVTPPAAQTPAAPAFDTGFTGFHQAPRRITQERLTSAAVESRPHPALPPEAKLNSENRLLEMRVYWGDVLLTMHHFVKPRKITIGETKRTDVFISSEGLPIEEFPIVRYMDDEYVLSFTNAMEGEVQIGGETRGLDQVRRSDWAKKDPDMEGAHRLRMPVDSRCLVHWGGATFALRFVSPSTAIPTSVKQNVDFAFVNTFVLSTFLHIAALVTLLVYPYDTESLRVDLFDKPDRFASLILEAPKETKSTKDMLKKIKKSVEEKKEKLKKPAEKKKDLLKVTKTTIPKNVPQKKTQEQRAQEVKKRFSKLFSGGSGGGSLLGGGGGGSLSGSLANVIGTRGSGSATAGIAGLGIRGTGPLTGGGIGTSRGIAGIGTAGRLGGGGLAYGAGVGIGKRKDRSIISLSTPVVMGALPADVIKKVINQNKNQVRYCYEVELQRNQNLEGRIMVRWVIAATGDVAKVVVKDSTMKNPNVERCLVAKIRTWKFPRPAGGGIVEVNYPFVFKAS